MIHYHGTPITPRAKLLAELPGRCFCVSYAAPGDIQVCHEIGQMVMLDNGAFSAWTKGRAVGWPGYYRWCEPWLEYHTTWAVIPDVIDGDEADNDALLREWPHGDKGAPVWHMHESIDRLKRLCDTWPRVCVGSSGQYASPSSDSWRRRIETAMDAICGNGPAPVWLHMLRAMHQASGGPYPFASTDSTNLARNHAGAASVGRPARSLRAMADEVDGRQSPARWHVCDEQMQLG